MSKSNYDNNYHNHNFNDLKHSSEKKTKIVLIITIVAMFIEIITGWIFNSMALFADGWHMSTHAAALGITLIAYILARKFYNDRLFTFGTWKIEILGAYTSSIILGIVGLFVLGVSVKRFFVDVEINYNHALIVAVFGLVINLICAFILQEHHHHHEHHEHEHNENNAHHHNHHHHHDLNMRSAYIHVITDAMTSVFAIIALLGAKYFQWNWLDPAMGIVGAFLILRWTYTLVTETSVILLDRQSNFETENNIKNIVENDGESKLTDIHIIKVSTNKIACILSISTKNNFSPEDYSERLKIIEDIAHLNIEINSSNN